MICTRLFDLFLIAKLEFKWENALSDLRITYHISNYLHAKQHKEQTVNVHKN